MHERLYIRKLASAAAISLAGLTALTGCSSGSQPQAKSECIGVGFGSEKGGPGLIGVDVHPIFKTNDEVATKVFGSVVAGNDKGELITNSPVFANAGEFALSWNETDKNIQTTTVKIEALVAGRPQLQTCPETSMHFDPNTNNITPTYK